MNDLTDDLTTDSMPIAIVGMACRFPAGEKRQNLDTPKAYWNFLIQGRDAIQKTPKRRRCNKDGDQWGGFLKHIDTFDPFFFGISPREAEQMDPQQRILLELLQETLQEAGITQSSIKGSDTGIFIGCMRSEYSSLNPDKHASNIHAATGGHHAVVSGRLSYVFNLMGPNMTINTACSSSLVAVHQACQAIRSGETNCAFAGGVNLILDPQFTADMDNAGTLSADGRCRPFDENANGYVRSEGAGLVLLKSLDDAERDGNPIVGVIKASAINSNGTTDGLTATSVSAQKALLKKVYRAGGINPAQVGYIEAHGTGTALGDPNEAQALGEVLGKSRAADTPPLIIGSCKSNIGHTEGSAGIAGLIKTVRVLQTRIIPPNLHFNSANPRINFSDLHVTVPTKAIDFPASCQFAGVSSFGFSTNCHIVLEQVEKAISARPSTKRHLAPLYISQLNSLLTDINPDPLPTKHLLLVSAHYPYALEQRARDIADFLKQEKEVSLNDLCFTSALKRDHYNHRLAIVANTKEDFISQLSVSIDQYQKIKYDSHPKLAFVFPGQGSQWLGMGACFINKEPLFLKTITHCDALISQHCDWSLLEVLMNTQQDNFSNDVDIIQPALFSIQYALACLWQEKGVTPHAVIGHSLGEIAASCYTGALSLEDAIEVICRRSQGVRDHVSSGAMAVVELAPERIRSDIKSFGKSLVIAAVNSAENTLISGDNSAVDEYLRSLEKSDVFYSKVDVNYASHSPHMDKLSAKLKHDLKSLQARDGSVPIYSTTTGEVLTGSQLNGDYWAKNIRNEVLFYQQMKQLLNDGFTHFVEISPHPIATYSIESCIREHGLTNSCVIDSLRRNADPHTSLIDGIAELYISGYTPNWKNFYPADSKMIDLPLQRYHKQYYWQGRQVAEDRSTPQRTHESNKSINKKIDNVTDKIQSATGHEKNTLAEEYIMLHAGQTLRLPRKYMQKDASLLSYGIDSLMIMELRNRLAADLNVSLSTKVFFRANSIVEIASYIVQQLDSAKHDTSTQKAKDSAEEIESGSV